MGKVESGESPAVFLGSQPSWAPLGGTTFDLAPSSHSHASRGYLQAGLGQSPSAGPEGMQVLRFCSTAQHGCLWPPHQHP
jgi:hypothetical protein